MVELKLGEFTIFHFDMATVLAGLQVMLYGLIGVFTVLILFFAVTKLMVFIANKVPSAEKD